MEKLNLEEQLKNKARTNLIELTKELESKEEEQTWLQCDLESIEDDIEVLEYKISNIKGRITTGFIDFSKVSENTDDEKWLKLAIAEDHDNRRQMKLINYDPENKWLCSTNGKMLFLVNGVEKTTYKPVENYPKIKQLMPDHKLNEDFDLGRLEHINLQYSKYTTKTGVELGFTSELLACVLSMGAKPIVSYTTKVEPVLFEYDSRQALIMTVRDFALS
jgi:hypothetical protein